MEENKKEYSTGYRKPPKEHQFRPGQSGNPRGRPKRKYKTVKEIFTEISRELITITENGVSRKVTKLEAFFKQIFNSGLQGKDRASKTILNYAEKYNVKQQGEEPSIIFVEVRDKKDIATTEYLREQIKERQRAEGIEPDED